MAPRFLGRRGGPRSTQAFCARPSPVYTYQRRLASRRPTTGRATYSAIRWQRIRWVPGSTIRTGLRNATSR